jgi:LacI family transcriptional regulator
MMRGRVDGLVIMSPHLDAETLNRNLPQSLPVVLLNCYVDTDRFDSLNIDNYGGAYAMTRHLLSHGHKHIAILKGTEKNMDAAERLRGFNMAFDDHGGDGGVRYEISGNFSEAGGYDAVKEILALTPRPTAVFASNDSMAIGALSALRDSGLQVPKDIALAGFDDIPIASYMTPSLTTVRVGIHGLGVHAIETVLHAFKNKNEHRKQQVLLSTTLSLRGSCGCDQFNNVN